MLQRMHESPIDRRDFIGGSDARIIMGSSSPASPPRTSTGPGTSATPGGRSRRCRAGSSTRSSPSWRPPSTAWWRGRGRSTRPSCRHEKYMAQLQPALLAGPLSDSIAEPDTWAPSVLVDELNAGFFQNPFYVRERFWVACVPPDFKIGDRIAMQAGRLRKISHCPIQGGAGHSHLCVCHSHKLCYCHMC
jgi:hypothetical protein